MEINVEYKRKFAILPIRSRDDTIWMRYYYDKYTYLDYACHGSGRMLIGHDILSELDATIDRLSAS